MFVWVALSRNAYCAGLVPPAHAAAAAAVHQGADVALRMHWRSTGCLPIALRGADSAARVQYVGTLCSAVTLIMGMEAVVLACMLDMLQPPECLYNTLRLSDAQRPCDACVGAYCLSHCLCGPCCSSNATHMQLTSGIQRAPRSFGGNIACGLSAFPLVGNLAPAVVSPARMYQQSCTCKAQARMGHDPT